TGFLRLAAMAYVLGISETRLADTYNLANVTPNIVYELVLGGVLSAVLLRVYVEVREREGQEEAWRFISRVTNLSTLILSGVALLGIAAAPLLLKAYTFYAPGADRVGQEVLGTLLLRLFIPQLLFYGFSTISTAVLHAHRRFGVPMFAPVANNLVVTATFIAFGSLVPSWARSIDRVPFGGRLLLGLGTTAGVAVMGLVPWFFMRRVGWRRVRRAGFTDPAVRRLASLSAYTLGYALTNQLGLWVTLVLANRIQGGVTAYQIAFVFFQLPHGLFAVSISASLSPSLAERAVAGDLGAFAGQLVRGLRATAFIILPAVAGYLAVAPELVRFLLEHGIATGSSTELISAVLRAFALGLVFFTSFHLILRGFQALGDTRTPMLVNMGGLAVNLAVNLTLFLSLADPRLKVAGLALGHAASYAFVSVTAFLILRRRLGGVPVAPLRRTLARCGLAAAVTGGASWAIARVAGRALDTDLLLAQGLQLALAACGGGLVYLAAVKVLRVEELAWIRTLLGRRAV
ncbi:MAG: murein biosynthesis integral membrane protein MurJ, partial [Candidatus Methylomirabilales bacterium]